MLVLWSLWTIMGSNTSSRILVHFSSLVAVTSGRRALYDSGRSSAGVAGIAFRISVYMVCSQYVLFYTFFDQVYHLLLFVRISAQGDRGSTPN